jgi:cytochrome c-type biogenesis protein CcmI
VDIAIFALLLVALAAFVASPLYKPASAAELPAPDARREALESALRDLELDRASGLLDDASYEQERSALESQLGD